MQRHRGTGKQDQHLNIQHVYVPHLNPLSIHYTLGSYPGNFLQQFQLQSNPIAKPINAVHHAHTATAPYALNAYFSLTTLCDSIQTRRQSANSGSPRQRDITTCVPPFCPLQTYNMRLSTTTTLFSLLSSISFTYAQSETGSAANAVASPDGLIVPFTSDLPPCASLCGPLFDVQGACTPPNIATVNDNCFCTDPRLSAFDTDAGTTGVSTVCGPLSCNAPADLQAIKTWFDNFCNTKQVVTTTAAGGAVSTSSGSSKPSSAGGGGNTWYVLICFIF